MKTIAKVRICDNRYLLRSVEIEDAEILRKWKNEHKEFFFFKQEISFEDQQKWIKSLEQRPQDHMFIIFDGPKPIGCIGARLYQEFVDIYNVILGDKSYKGEHIMTNALWSVVLLSNVLFINKPIRVRVLRTNPAIKWYEKIGFNTIDYFDDHVMLQFRNSSIKESYDFNLTLTLPIN